MLPDEGERPGVAGARSAPAPPTATPPGARPRSRASTSVWVPAATSASEVGVALGQDVGRAQPAVVLVDAQQARAPPRRGRRRRRRGRWWSAWCPPGGARRGSRSGGRPRRSCPWRAGRCSRPAPRRSRARRGAGASGTATTAMMRVAPRRDRGPDRDDLDHPAVDVVVVGHGVRWEDHGHAGRGDGPVDQVDRAGRLARAPACGRRPRRSCRPRSRSAGRRPAAR